jgi:hypothetical protein
VNHKTQLGYEPFRMTYERLMSLCKSYEPTADFILESSGLVRINSKTKEGKPKQDLIMTLRPIGMVVSYREPDSYIWIKLGLVFKTEPVIIQGILNLEESCEF